MHRREDYVYAAYLWAFVSWWLTLTEPPLVAVDELLGSLYPAAAGRI